MSHVEYGTMTVELVSYSGSWKLVGASAPHALIALRKLMGGRVLVRECNCSHSWQAKVVSCNGSELFSGRHSSTRELALESLAAVVRKAAMEVLSNEWSFPK